MSDPLGRIADHASKPTITIGRHPEYRHGLYCFWLDGKPTRLPVGTVASCLAGRMTDVELMDSYPWVTSEMIAATRSFDWPEWQDASPLVEDLTIDCSCGEEAGIVDDGRPHEEFDWGKVEYRCRCCGRRWIVRLTVEAAP